MKGATNEFRPILYLFGLAVLASSGLAAIGEHLWEQRYNGLGNGYASAYAVAVDAGGNVFVTGYSAGTAGVADYATIKHSDAGIALWTNHFLFFSRVNTPPFPYSLLSAPVILTVSRP
jgi:hypothetical protein